LSTSVVPAALGDALARQITFEDGVGRTRINVIGPDQEEAVDPLGAQEIDGWDRLLRRRRAGIENVA
jgi:hypothetical protein